MLRIGVVLCVAWSCYFLFESAWIRLLPQDPRFQLEPVSASVAAATGRKALAALSVIAIGLWFVWAKRKWLWRHVQSGRIAEWVFTLGCSWAIFVVLRQEGAEASWYPLRLLIENPGASPIFGHRLLFVWPAQLMLFAAPGLGAMAAFLASQIVPIVGTTYLAGRLSAMIAGESLAFIGQVLLVVFLSPTFGYYNFYDIAIVGFSCAMLLCLLHRRFTWFVLTAGAATLNHENALLWILAGAFAIWPDTPRKQAVTFTASALALHIAVRLALQAAIPMARIADLRIWTNPLDLARMPLIWTLAVGLLVFRWCAAFAFFQAAPPEVRRLAVLLPLLFVTTTMFGQFHEVRQFNASIPLEIAFVLYGLRAMIAYGKFVPPAKAAA